MNNEQRKAFNDAACAYVCEDGSTLSVMASVYKLAIEAGMLIKEHDKSALRIAVSRRVRSQQRVRDSTDPDHPCSDELENIPPVEEPTQDVGAPQPRSPLQRVDNRTGRCGRKPKADGTVKSDTALRPFKGAKSHQDYQIAVKTEVAAAVQDFNERGFTVRKAALGVRERLSHQGISLGLRKCSEHVTSALSNDGVPFTPQKPGGVYVSSAIESRIAALVKHLRSRKLPVFPEDVMAWCSSLIEGTHYAANFIDGQATEGWYRGFLRRQNMLTGNERPLETTRRQWYSEENLCQYYEVAAGVLIDAGVAELNPDYDPSLPYMERVKITHPERIASCDETRIELDCTQGGKGRTDRVVRAGIEDDGECLVTKSSSTATAMCGRRGDGKAIPPTIVFSSGEGFHPSWTRKHESAIPDGAGKPLQWRYRSNAKGSMTEELFIAYLKDTIHPAVGSPKPTTDEPGSQAVLVCDGVGTHCGVDALETALSLGIHVLLRVPHLSHKLQGEDTVNFAVLKVLPSALPTSPVNTSKHPTLPWHPKPNPAALRYAVGVLCSKHSAKTSGRSSGRSTCTV